MICNVDGVLPAASNSKTGVEPTSASGKSVDAVGSGEMSRREMLKVAAGAAIAAPIVLAAASSGRAATAPDKAHLFFTQDEFAIVDELTELIIPADDHSPGARAAEVADYIDRRLSEAAEPDLKQQWHDGLKLVDKLCSEMHGHRFIEASGEQRVAVLSRMAQNERAPKQPEEVFFGELKSRTARAYYSSKTGIKTEMEYKGNSYLKEFVGYEGS
jgi:hypothetical protein